MDGLDRDGSSAGQAADVLLIRLYLAPRPVRYGAGASAHFSGPSGLAEVARAMLTPSQSENMCGFTISIPQDASTL